jgi:REP element-mobilizing transposase RayT
MPEHIHLLLTEPEEANFSTVMQVLKQRTARAPLPKSKRTDPRQPGLFGRERQRAFWQARFYDFNVWTTRKRVEKLRYMHRNPVKRRLVESPEHWRWSSYRFYLVEEVGSVRVNEAGPGSCFEIEQPRLRHCMRSWYPPFAQTAKDGAPIVLLMPARSKAWATRLIMIRAEVSEHWSP